MRPTAARLPQIHHLALPLAAAAAALLGSLAAAPARAQTSLPEQQVNALEGLAGKQPGFRRAQAKGLCASGYFEGNAAARALSSASVFNGDKVPVLARFSVGGGNPKASEKARSVRGLSLQFSPANGESWMTANISAPVYFVRTAEDFVGFVQVRSNDPATGKPDADKLKAWNDAHPEALIQGAYLAKAPVPASFATVNYWGVNAFELSDAQGARQFVRWQFVPEAGVLGLTDEQLKDGPAEFLADELRARVAKGPVGFEFKLQLAGAGDNLLDATQAWPDSRTTVSAGRLVIDKVEAAAGGACDRITFNPLITPKGIAPSADPVLQARAAAYGISLGRRLGEAAAMPAAR
jgi:catalase